ncbi:unnamed protein product, partial [Hapterophycus canaliculatus]
SSLHFASVDGSPGRTIAALPMRSTDVDERDPSGATALTLAARKSHSQVVRILLDPWCLHVDIRSKRYYRSSRGGCSGHVLIAVTKTPAEAEVDFEATFTMGQTPLFLAACTGHAGTIRVLAEAGANPDACLLVPDGKTALLMACREGSLDVVVELLRAKADPLLHASRHPCPIGCGGGDYCRHSEVVSAMIQLVGIEGCGGVSGGQQALRLAVYNDDIAVAKILTSARVRDAGEALMTTILTGSGALLKFLLQQDNG